MIEIRALTKSFGLRPVLRSIDLSLDWGECVALLGPNGAGKTTLLRTVATLTRPDMGRIRVWGMNLDTHAHVARGILGYVSHHPLLYGELTAEDNLRFYARLYGLSDVDDLIDAALTQVGLTRRRRDHVGNFSRGMKQRLAIGRAILHQPRVMLLDEPHTGLDHDAAAMLDEVLGTVTGSGRTVLMTTHDIDRGLALADRVAILSNGEIAYEADSSYLTPLELSRQYSHLLHGKTH